jgi:hypothetical protein
LGFFDSSILRFFDFCLDDGQEIEGGGWTDPTSILRFFDFSIYVWTGTDHPNETEKNRIAKFGYSGDPNNQIFGYSVIRVTRNTKYSVIWFFRSPE